MRKICTTLAVLLFAVASWANVNVTFRVDMTNQTVGGNGVHLVGDLQSEAGFPADWEPFTTAMTDANVDNIYEVTLSLPESTTFNYKFVNGNSWGSDEQSIPGVCNSGGNRFFTTGTSNELRPVFCFNQCSFCASNPQFRNVTFQVDMQNVTVSGNGVHLAGGFGVSGYANWNPGNLPGAIVMTDANADEVYEVTLSLNEGYYYEFKFINGNSWGSDESVPGGCATNNNRSFICPTAPSSVRPEVCFTSCSDCIAIPEIVEVKFQVDMNNVPSVSMLGVHMAGGFGVDGYPQWDPSGITMLDANSDLIYEVTLLLTEGTNYQYKFINGNAWGMDEGSIPGACNVGGNRDFTVPGAAIDLPAVCFNSCVACVAPPATVSVTFRVNMGQASVSLNGVHLAGDFGPNGYPNWNPAGIQMTDGNADNIYEITLNLFQGQSYEYKFINGNDWPFAENVPGECALGFNRYLAASAGSLPVVCYSSCTACPAGPANDARAGATSVAVYNFGSCLTKSGDLSLASPSAESNSFCVTGGHDTWHRFVASSVGVRIVVSAPNTDVLIELQDAAGNTLAEENARVGTGTEILNYYNGSGLLVNGQTYFIAVRNYNTAAATGPGNYTVCIQRLSAPSCNQGPGPYQMCNTFKSSFVGAQTYTFTFTNSTTLAETVVAATGGITIVPLSSLLPGFSYSVAISASYSVQNGNNETETFTIASANSCMITMAAQPSIVLRAQDVCASGPRPVNAIIGANTWLCGATHYEWQFQQVAPLSEPTYGAPIAGPSTNRFLAIPAGTLTPGATYNVQIRPIFPGGVQGSWGAIRCLTIVGPAAMVLAPQEEVAPTLRTATDQTVDTVFRLYPNPSNGERIQLTFSDMESDHTVVRVIDPVGRLVTSALFSVKNGDTRILEFGESLSDGIYMIQVISNGTEQTQRLVVQSR